MQGAYEVTQSGDVLSDHSTDIQQTSIDTSDVAHTKVSFKLISQNGLLTQHLCDVLKERLAVNIELGQSLQPGALPERNNPLINLIDAVNMNAADILRTVRSFEQLIDADNRKQVGLPSTPSCVFFNVSRQYDLEIRARYSGWRCLRGIIFAEQSLDSLVGAIDAISHGQFWLPRGYLEALMSQFLPRMPMGDAHLILTEKETEILVLLTNGLTNDQIGQRLFISPHTVKTHLHKLYRKINARNRVDASNWAKLNLDTAF